ncbi:MAG: hypothetical protein IJ055_07490 [Oscillospiraceae bacterium]|nr:hypothetical protein [Oscillospiraceae bacterium]
MHEVSKILHKIDDAWRGQKNASRRGGAACQKVHCRINAARNRKFRSLTGFFEKKLEQKTFKVPPIAPQRSAGGVGAF